MSIAEWWPSARRRWTATPNWMAPETAAHAPKEVLGANGYVDGGENRL